MWMRGSWALALARDAGEVRAGRMREWWTMMGQPGTDSVTGDGRRRVDSGEAQGGKIWREGQGHAEQGQNCSGAMVREWREGTGEGKKRLPMERQPVHGEARLTPWEGWRHREEPLRGEATSCRECLHGEGSE